MELELNSLDWNGNELEHKHKLEDMKCIYVNPLHSRGRQEMKLVPATKNDNTYKNCLGLFIVACTAHFKFRSTLLYYIM